MKLFRLMLKNLARNPVRAGLTALAVVFLVVVFSMIVTVLSFLDAAVTARSSDVAVVITERYRFPSRFDVRFMDDVVKPGSATNREMRQVPGFDPDKYTVWHFIGFTLDQTMQDKDLLFFCIATLPDKVPTMLEDLDQLDPAMLERLKRPTNNPSHAGIVLGPDRLKTIRKKVGDAFQATSISHRDKYRQPIKIDFEIVGELPANGRWSQGAFMDHAKLDTVLQETGSSLYGKVMLGWMKFADQESANQGSAVIEKNNPDVKCEIASTAVGRFLEPYKDLLWLVRWPLRLAILVVMVVIVANAVSISVRERLKEMAILKVLGFRPGQILALVLGEALFLGALAGLLGAAVTYGFINHVLGGISIPIGFFPEFFVPARVFWWGPALGAFAALAGSLLPALSARRSPRSTRNPPCASSPCC